MSKLVKEVSDFANELMESRSDITHFEALTIAVKIQHNRVLSDAFMLGKSCPSALEAIAMEMGAARDGDTIKAAIRSLRE